MKKIGNLKQSGTLQIETRPLITTENKLESRFSKLITASHWDAGDLGAPIMQMSEHASDSLTNESTDLSRGTNEQMPTNVRSTTGENFKKGTSSVHIQPTNGERRLTLQAQNLAAAIKQILRVVQSASANDVALGQCKQVQLSINQRGLPRICLLLRTSQSHLSLRIRVPDEPTRELIFMHQALLEQSLMGNAGTPASISMTVDLMDQEGKT